MENFCFRRAFLRPLHPEALRSELFRWFMLAPSLVLLLGVSVIPLLYSVRISLFSFRFGNPYKFVGLNNYIHLFRDPGFWHALGITTVFTVVAVAIEFVLGLCLALLVAGKLPPWLLLHALAAGRPALSLA